MKHQCNKHGCSELLCGCPSSELEDNGDFSEQVRAKDKWINELLIELGQTREELTLVKRDYDNLRLILEERV